MKRCKLCKKEIKGNTLICSKGTICSDCIEDISLAEYQPLASFGNILWILSETFFRKGQGEDISFEQVWNENENLKLIKFEDIFETMMKGGKK